MSKVDCSNIFNFIGEWNRMRKSEPYRIDVQTALINGEANMDDMRVFVHELQEWSDSHPQITRKEKFIKMCNENGFERLIRDRKCQHNMPKCIPKLLCKECMEYWNEVAE